MSTCNMERGTRFWLRPKLLGGSSSEVESWSWGKLGYGALGLVLIAIALAGAILPGVPTVMPLLAGSYFLSQCSPRLRDRILGWRIFRRYHVYLDPHRPISFRSRCVGFGAMWLSISVSCGMFCTLTGGRWICLGMILLGLVGSLVIACYRQTQAFWRTPWCRNPLGRSVRTLN